VMESVSTVSERTCTIGRESLALFILCIADALLTIMLISRGLVVEANPLARCCLESGVTMFLFAKMAPVTALIALAEWKRRSSPEFVRRALSAASTVYVLAYVISVIAANVA
jgi:hypothetical protein